MPTMNGTHYRTYGQGARAEGEKDKAGQALAAPAGESAGDKKMEGGSVTHIKHHEDGTHSIKHADGEMEKNVSGEDMVESLRAKHAGGDEFPDNGDGTDLAGSKAAIDSMLG